MTTRQRSWPRQWLMTDERMGEALWPALESLTGDAGIVVRHYSIAAAEREAIAHRIAEICRMGRITFAIAKDEELALALGADLVHNPPRRPKSTPFSLSVHSMDEAIAARDAGASLVFVSPVHETRSHPGRKALGHNGAIELAKAARVPAIALGGMNECNFAPLERDGYYGWAGIGAWIREPV
jgi:thiamine-phosphate pyrophosphorylase